MRVTEFDTSSRGIGQHRKLNPRLWQEDKLRPEVKGQLLKIAQLFREFVDLDFPVIDLQIVGAQAGYTYTDYSDLDLHLITDFKRIDCDQELRELFDTKRLLFKRQHQISIAGVPVEPGVEDLDQPTRGSSYSIMRDQWVRLPRRPDQVNTRASDQLAKKMIRAVRAVLDSGDRQSQQQVLKLLRQIRKQSLATDLAEFHPGNVAYKTLRNLGLIDDLQRAIQRAQDRALSLPN